MTSKEEYDFLEKYCGKFVKITTSERLVYGMIDGLESACDSDSGDTEIGVAYIGKRYGTDVLSKDIISIELITETECADKNEIML